MAAFGIPLKMVILLFLLGILSFDGCRADFHVGYEQLHGTVAVVKGRTGFSLCCGLCLPRMLMMLSTRTVIETSTSDAVECILPVV